MPRIAQFICRSVVALAGVAVLGFWSNSVSAQDQAQADEGGIPEIVVTSQRVEQAITKVPIAVTVFDASAMDRQQIEGFGDLQFSIPNVTFAKTNFTTSNFQIRGVGNTLVAASADQGVGIHINDVPINTPRLFETEYFDVERVEILRGPQGTLFGRNSTGGAVNMITKRPTDEFESKFELEYGNYDSKRAEGMLNVPLTDNLAMRIAALFVNRDGYTENIATGNDVDGRDSYALRASFRLTPGDTTEINLMVSYFDENSTRTRSQKQMCKTDPTGLLGCMPDELAFENVNLSGTLFGILVSDAVLGPLGLYSFADPLASGVNPADFRKVNLDFEPVYRSDELLMIGEVAQEIGESYSFTLIGSYQDTSVFSETDYNADFGPEITVPGVLPFALPNVFNALYSDGQFPISEITPGNSGLIGFNIRDRNNILGGYDRSTANAEQFTLEGRLQSDFDGRFNFLVGAFYMHYKADFNYWVVGTGLDYFSVVGGGALIADGITVPTPYFNSDTPKYTLNSMAGFGEVYYDFTDELRLTAGIRYTVDKKTISDRANLFDAFQTGGFVPLGTDPIPDAALNPIRDGFAGDPDGKVKFKEPTGRLVLEWQPTMDGFDSSLFYASYSRGYKGGGFNPPFVASEFPDQSQFFDPEFVNAFEIGSKLRFANNTMSLNTSAFYYDYKGLQVSKIVNRTSFNENIDAEVYGVEAEAMWAPDQNWMFNATASYLGSSIGDSESVDPRDPTAGATDVTLIKDLSNGSNCVLHHNGLPDPGIVPYSSCSALIAAFDGTPYTVDGGNPVSLKGNELRQAPDFSLNIGAQYTYYFGNGMSLTSRVDYYFQTAMWGRIFNRDPVDRIASFDIWNAQVTLTSADETWFMRFFIQNIENDDDVTGMYLTDASSGLWTNVFTTEPRRYGIILGAQF